MRAPIRIGTRDSQLATWQASLVASQLQQQGYGTELVPVRSEGDLDLITPLYAMGVQGVFSRQLDSALLNRRIDLAVHSMKDVPTLLAQGLAQAAVLPRAEASDMLLYRGGLDFLDPKYPAVIATGSIRRKAQWLNRYPAHRIENLRGNLNTRLAKLEASGWNGALFAAAGLKRIGLQPQASLELDWMLPAPAQGAILVCCRSSDDPMLEACRKLHDAATDRCVTEERAFLQALMGGCSTPISAHAAFREDRLIFRGNITLPDGSHRMDTELRVPVQEAAGTGSRAAQQLLDRGAGALLQRIRAALPIKPSAPEP